MHEAALEAVAARLAEHDVPFLLGGSALLYALGIDVAVRDLDLMLRAKDRERFEAAAGDWLVSVTTEPGPVLTSAWGGAGFVAMKASSLVRNSSAFTSIIFSS